MWRKLVLHITAYILLACGLLTLYGITRLPAECNRICVRFDKDNIPILEATLEGQKARLEFILGGGSALSMSTALIERLGAKRSEETHLLVDHKGQQSEVSAYHITSLKIGGREFRHWLGYETNYWDQFEDSEGGIGYGILKWSNVLLNFPKEEIILCPRVDLLPKLGFKPDRMIKLPLLESPLLTVECETDLGVGRATINTGCTYNCIRAGLLQNLPKMPHMEDEPGWHSKHLYLGGVDYGPCDFAEFPLEIPQEPADWVIGMSFLAKHVVYIDYVHRCVYISRPS